VHQRIAIFVESLFVAHAPELTGHGRNTLEIKARALFITLCPSNWHTPCINPGKPL